MTTLLLSSRHSEDNQALWRAAIKKGWSVERARGLNVPEITDAEIVLYVEALYAPTIAKQMGQKLLEVGEDWLAKLPLDFSKREISLTSLGEARSLSASAFVKPPNDKSFLAKVYQSGAELPEEYDDDIPVLIAEPVNWLSEFRCFCLDGQVMTLSPYLREGTLAKESEYQLSDVEAAEASRVVNEVLVQTGKTTPDAVVIDVGVIEGQGWAIVEANAAWGSGIYGCEPEVVLDVIRHATIQMGV